MNLLTDHVRKRLLILYDIVPMHLVRDYKFCQFMSRDMDADTLGPAVVFELLDLGPNP